MRDWAVFVALAAGTGSLLAFRGSRVEHFVEGMLAVSFVLIAVGLGLGLVH